MRHFFLLLVGLLPLLLFACSTIRDTQLEAEATPETLQFTGDGEDHESKAYPHATAALWANGFLWTANETGLLTRWDIKAGEYQQYHLPGDLVIRSLASDGHSIYAGTEGGGIWRIAHDESPTQVVSDTTGSIPALAFATNQDIWYAELGRGLVVLGPDEGERVYNLIDKNYAGDDPLKHITTLVFDPERAILWMGTLSGGVLSYDTGQGIWRSYNTFNSGLGNNAIHALALASDSSVWAATPSGVSCYRDSKWESHYPANGREGGSALSLDVSRDHTVWVAGESYIARMNLNETWQAYSAVDNSLLSDRSRFVVLDDEGDPWFIGRRGKVHFDGQTWTAYDADVRRFAQFTPFQPLAPAVPPPRDFPSPSGDYLAWLKTWPRPAADNGRGLHFLRTHQYDTVEAQKQVNRMQRLGVRWALVPYTDHEQLVRTAPIFEAAGITVVWRPFVRPFETYSGWAEDVAFLRSRGLAPYFQFYNEPSLPQEWDDLHPLDQETYLRHLLPAVRQVYDAGGYIGLQFVNPDWLRLTLRAMKDRDMSDTFNRLFFVAHLYGLNHPPDYEEDINGVLGFREFARVFEEEIGFVPVMIAGEGGWRPGEAQDDRFPAISQELHRDYHLAVFDWFRIGELSNGESLPDYFFAFCPWLISDPDDPAAWFDSGSGDRSLTVETIEAMPPFERKFSWDR